MPDKGETIWSQRQQDVLETVLRLLVEMGDRVTMSAVARHANCSKETLYKWFGDRDGLLTATVKWQASRVTFRALEDARPDLAAVEASLTDFAANWLSVISSETSLALNRVAIGQTGADKMQLGRIVLENGRFALGARLKPLLEAGREAGILAFEDSETAFRVFFGLFARDIQIRLLLGDDLRLSPDCIRLEAAEAARQFFKLFASPERAGALKP
ncbi:MAG: TetR/AcrR family transcriptional regulator [Proteobacteria bacterium]|nr:TetR/AcrR family transcriptional regulator [Pseudomonadota bacterium]